LFISSKKFETIKSLVADDFMSVINSVHREKMIINDYVICSSNTLSNDDSFEMPSEYKSLSPTTVSTLISSSTASSSIYNEDHEKEDDLKSCNSNLELYFNKAIGKKFYRFLSYFRYF